MATRYWVGGTGTQLWTNTANWSTSSGGAGGASVPSAGDTVYIDSGTSSITGTPGTDLAALYVTFGGTLGTELAPLVLGIIDLFRYTPYGSGTSYLDATSVLADHAWQIYNTGSGGGLSLGGSALILFDAFDGYVAIRSTSTGSLGYRNYGATVTVLSGSNYATSLVVYNYRGTSKISRACPSSCQLGVFGGQVSYMATGLIGGLEAWNGGNFYYTGSGGFTRVDALSGSNLYAAGAIVPFTIATLHHYANASVFQDATVLVTITTQYHYGFP